MNNGNCMKWSAEAGNSGENVERKNNVGVNSGKICHA